MAKEKIKIGQEGIYDARKLGTPKMVVLCLYLSASSICLLCSVLLLPFRF